jgi:Protein of unknown function (DUF3105)
LGRRRGSPGRRGTTRVGGGERNWGLIILVVAVIAFLGAFIAVVALDVSQRAARTPPGGVESFENLSRNHTEGPVDYEQTPPVGGPHNLVWQNAGFYAEPIPNENAVHTLEHGAVWITYRPDLPQEQVEKIRDLVQGEPCALASPYEGLPSPVVASAWGKQLEIDSAEDPDLERFIRTYQQGPQTPEPGASCTGGTGTPET